MEASLDARLQRIEDMLETILNMEAPTTEGRAYAWADAAAARRIATLESMVARLVRALGERQEPPRGTLGGSPLRPYGAIPHGGGGAVRWESPFRTPPRLVRTTLDELDDPIADEDVAGSPDAVRLVSSSSSSNHEEGPRASPTSPVGGDHGEGAARKSFPMLRLTTTKRRRTS